MRPLGLAGLAIVLVSCNRSPERRQVPSSPADASPSSADGREQGSTLARATQLALGHDHTCVLLADGVVRCWGLGTFGRLGTGSTATIGDDEPASAGKRVELGAKAVAITAGTMHTCALLESRRVRCWGQGKMGALGYGTPDDVGDDETPASIGDVPLGEDVVQVAAGGSVTCALLVSGSVRCWGDNLDGALGLPGTKQPRYIGDDEPVDSLPAIKLDRKVLAIGGARAEMCALFDDRKVRCWGELIGSPDPEHAAEKRRDIDVGADVAKLAGSTLMCVVTTRGGARCWGSGRALAEGVGVERNSGDDWTVLADTPDLPLPAPVEEIAMSGDHACVLLAGGKVRCWGDRRLGILGVPPGDVVSVGDAVEVELGEPATDVAVGAFHSCALSSTGAVRCWGMAKDGRLGYGTAENVGEKRAPAAVGTVPLQP